jgi:hypothetical protein
MIVPKWGKIYGELSLYLCQVDFFFEYIRGIDVISFFTNEHFPDNKSQIKHEDD